MKRDFLNVHNDDLIVEASAEQSRSFIANVFGYMFLALTITGLTSWWFANTSAIQLIYNEQGGINLMGWVFMLAPLVFLLVIQSRFEKLSLSTLLLIFIAFSFCFGVSLSSIFIIYTLPSIALTFGVCSVTFGIMAVVGYTTKTDLTKFGNILMMGLIGIIIAMVVNFFLKSAFMDYVISMIGVLIFTGLTAYDMQKIKRMGAGVDHGSITASKLSLMGAITLYLDFLNLFMFLLRFLGDRK